MKRREPMPAYKVLQVFRRDKFTCQYCGQRGGYLEIDHVVPVALGGSNSEVNLVTACRRCNRRKGKKLWKLGNKKANLKAENIQSLSSVLRVETSELMNEELEKPEMRIVSDSYENGRDILMDNKAGHLVFRDGNRVIDIPDTPENKNIYLRVVEQMLNVSGMMRRIDAVTI